MTSVLNIEISVNNYDSPCQDYLYPQDHTQRGFDITSDHSRKRKSNSPKYLGSFEISRAGIYPQYPCFLFILQGKEISHFT